MCGRLCASRPRGRAGAAASAVLSPFPHPRELRSCRLGVWGGVGSNRVPDGAVTWAPGAGAEQRAASGHSTLQFSCSHRGVMEKNSPERFLSLTQVCTSACKPHFHVPCHGAPRAALAHACGGPGGAGARGILATSVRLTANLLELCPCPRGAERPVWRWRSPPCTRSELSRVGVANVCLLGGWGTAASRGRPVNVQ